MMEEEKKTLAPANDYVQENTGWWEDKDLLGKIASIDAKMESGEDKGTPWHVAKTILLRKT